MYTGQFTLSTHDEHLFCDAVLEDFREKISEVAKKYTNKDGTVGEVGDISVSGTSVQERTRSGDRTQKKATRRKMSSHISNKRFDIPKTKVIMSLWTEAIKIVSSLMTSRPKLSFRTLRHRLSTTSTKQAQQKMHRQQNKICLDAL